MGAAVIVCAAEWLSAWNSSEMVTGRRRGEGGNPPLNILDATPSRRANRGGFSNITNQHIFLQSTAQVLVLPRFVESRGFVALVQQADIQPETGGGGGNIHHRQRHHQRRVQC